MAVCRPRLSSNVSPQSAPSTRHARCNPAVAARNTKYRFRLESWQFLKLSLSSRRRARQGKRSRHRRRDKTQKALRESTALMEKVSSTHIEFLAHGHGHGHERRTKKFRSAFSVQRSAFSVQRSAFSGLSPPLSSRFPVVGSSRRPHAGCGLTLRSRGEAQQPAALRGRWYGPLRAAVCRPRLSSNVRPHEIQIRNLRCFAPCLKVRQCSLPFWSTRGIPELTHGTSGTSDLLEGSTEDS